MNDKDDMALQELKKLLGNQTSYYDATQKLLEQGFTQIQIDNANAALKAGKDSVNYNPALADGILQVDKALQAQKERTRRNSGKWIYFPNSFNGGFAWIPDYVNSWWYLIIPFLAAIFLIYIISR